MRKLLIIAPHPDDELLGCGGSIIKNIAGKNKVDVCFCCKGMPPLFSPELVQETRKDCLECHRMIGINRTYFLDFPSVALEQVPRYQLNGRILDVIQESRPDEVYIPHFGDMQKDHQIVAEASMVALRPKYGHPVKRILVYETLSETGWNIPNVQNEFIPNVFTDISEFLEAKLEALAMYKTEISDFPDARSLEACQYLAKYRGALMHVKAAEAFMLVRELL